MSVTDIVTFMPSVLERLYPVAEARAGLFTTAQARAVGVSRRMLTHHAASGLLERRSHGIYRLTHFPEQRFTDLVEIVLWAGADAAISHESALAVYDLADVMPTATNVTLPRRFRGRRTGVIVHMRELDDADRTVRDAVRVTSVERTILDVARDGDPDLAKRAAAEALERGLTTTSRLKRYLDSHDVRGVLPSDRTRGPR